MISKKGVYKIQFVCHFTRFNCKKVFNTRVLYSLIPQIPKGNPTNEKLLQQHKPRPIIR